MKGMGFGMSFMSRLLLLRLLREYVISSGKKLGLILIYTVGNMASKMGRKPSNSLICKNKKEIRK